MLLLRLAAGGAACNPVMDPETGLDAIRNIGIRDRKIATISKESLQGRTTLI
jgi:hypothetical protein